MNTRTGNPPRMEYAAYEPIELSANEPGRADDHIEGLGFGISEMRSVARRQLAGSIVVAFGIAVVVGLTALRPAHETSNATASNFPVVRQPIMMPISEHVVATKQYKIDGLRSSISR
ncbi:MAG TPA: hypothetical protein VGY52_11925 [Roseiarcus sp.]|nr:hypothetical protein [Roseiarcus sp.]